MEKFIYVSPERNDSDSPRYDHCYFNAGSEPAAGRQVDLRKQYPYVAFPVSYAEFKYCNSSLRAGRPVKLTDGRYIREARVVRLTSLGVAAFRFTGEPRLPRL